MKEDRVKFANYGQINTDDPRLVPIPSSNRPQRLHWYAAARLEEMTKAAAKEGHEIKIASGWRRKLWPTRAAYEADMIKQYGSVAKGRQLRAYESPHMTGLAIDIGTGGLQPVSKTSAAQRKTPLYAWLTENAFTYGFTPYLREPWHWEANIGREAWDAAPGEIDTPSTTGAGFKVAIVVTSLLVAVVAAKMLAR